MTHYKFEVSPRFIDQVASALLQSKSITPAESAAIRAVQDEHGPNSATNILTVILQEKDKSNPKNIKK